MVNLKKGFTLIELLVVIAIIGILSSVVLASLNTARGKGANAAIKSNLNSMRAQAEIVYDNATPNVYNAVCTDSNVVKGMTGAAASAGLVWTSVTNNVAGTFCTNAGTTWIATVILRAPEGAITHWCVDNTGTSRGLTAGLALSATVCP